MTSLTTIQLASADFLDFEAGALNAHIKELIGKPLRRAGELSSLALLASLRCMDRERWPAADLRPELPTVLLWHTKTFLHKEACGLLKTMINDDDAIMPFDFLASQPALIGVNIAPWMPPLKMVIGLPWMDGEGRDVWQRSLQLAALWLGSGACRRVICAQLGRELNRHELYAISLVGSTEDIQSLGTVAIRPTCRAQAPMAASDFIAQLRHWLDRGASHANTLTLHGGTVLINVLA